MSIHIQTIKHWLICALDDFDMYNTGMTRTEVRSWITTHNRSREIERYPSKNGLRLPATSKLYYNDSVDNYEHFLKAMASASPYHSEHPFDKNALIEAHARLDIALTLLEHLKERELPYAAKLIEALIEACVCFLKLTSNNESGICWAEQLDQALRECPSVERLINFRSQPQIRIKTDPELEQIRRMSARSSPTLPTPPISPITPTVPSSSQGTITVGEAWYDTERPGNLKFVGVFVTDDKGAPRRTVVSRPFEIAHDYRVVSEMVKANGTIPNMVCLPHQFSLNLPIYG